MELFSTDVASASREAFLFYCVVSMMPMWFVVQADDSLTSALDAACGSDESSLGYLSSPELVANMWAADPTLWLVWRYCGSAHAKTFLQVSVVWVTGFRWCTCCW